MAIRDQFDVNILQALIDRAWGGIVVSYVLVPSPGRIALTLLIDPQTTVYKRRQMRQALIAVMAGIFQRVTVSVRIVEAKNVKF